jgi:hypothetical protein
MSCFTGIATMRQKFSLTHLGSIPLVSVYLALVMIYLRPTLNFCKSGCHQLATRANAHFAVPRLLVKTTPVRSWQRSLLQPVGITLVYRRLERGTQTLSVGGYRVSPTPEMTESAGTSVGNGPGDSSGPLSGLQAATVFQFGYRVQLPTNPATIVSESTSGLLSHPFVIYRKTSMLMMHSMAAIELTENRRVRQATTCHLIAKI